MVAPLFHIPPEAIGMATAGFLKWLTCQRKERGVKWCRKWGAGAMRKEVGADSITHDMDIVVAGRSIPMNAINRAWEGALAVHCGLCGKCPLARVGSKVKAA